MKNKTILITGAAGFIGANLAIKLLKKKNDFSIIGLDNMNSYYDVSIKHYRLKQINDLANLNANAWTFINGDISDIYTIQKIFTEHKPDIVVNLAAQAGVRYSITNPDADRKSVV